MVKRVTLLIVVLAAAVGLLSAGIVLLSTRAEQADPRVPVTVIGGEAPAIELDKVADITPFESPEPVPRQPFTDGAGHPVSLDDFRGQIVLLNFWATWCMPCVREMPSLDRLQAKLGERGLAVVALSQDQQGAAAVKPFYERLDLSHLGVYLDSRNRVGHAFEVQGLPTTFLIDRQGRAVGKVMGPVEWDSPETLTLIERYLDAPSGEGANLIRTGG